jgi:hypothetical protein
MDRGVIYVAYGVKALKEARRSIASLAKVHPGLPVLVVTDQRMKETATISVHLDTEPRPGLPGRWAKTHLDELTRWNYTLFLDADTVVHGSLAVGFMLLNRGYDLVMVPSRPQGEEILGHLSEAERVQTLEEVPGAVQLNTGVMWFNLETVAPLFSEWRTEWKRWHGPDQGAFLRALARVPTAIALLGLSYNSLHGRVVEHRFGACK